MCDPAKSPSKECEVRPQDGDFNKTQELEDVIEPIIISKDLPDEEKVQQIVNIMKVTQESFSGPLPHPEILKGYREIITDAPERILKMAELEQLHRIEAENEMLSQNRCNIEGSINANYRSQIFAFVLVLVLIGLGGFFVYRGYDVVAGILFGTTILGIASVFLTGRHRRVKEDENENNNKTEK